MTPYRVYLKRSAEKELDRLPAQVHTRIVKRLVSLRDRPLPPGAKKIHEKEGYRIRVGDYRILYIIDEPQKRVEIVSVVHRKDAYR